MSPRRRFASLAVLAALAALGAGCFSDEGSAWLPTGTVVPAKVRTAAVVPRNGSGVVGLVIIEYDTSPALLTVRFQFPGVGRNDVGARYPVHIHTGSDCSGVDVPVDHDLGAPSSSIQAGDLNVPSANIYVTPLPIQHLGYGYYLDVHAPNEPTGPPLACAVFP